jgi:8-oxo-dGTP pyrophosphatase MutT (NUDIX family)
MIKASGACIIAKDTKRILLQQRSDAGSYPRNWGFWGGKVEPKENVSQAMLRELSEEVGDIGDHILKVYPLDQYHSRDGEFSYYTFVVVVDIEFIPITNSETGGYAWLDRQYLPKPLHPGARRTLFKKDKIKIVKNIISKL